MKKIYRHPLQVNSLLFQTNEPFISKAYGVLRFGNPFKSGVLSLFLFLLTLSSGFCIDNDALCEGDLTLYTGDLTLYESDLAPDKTDLTPDKTDLTPDKSDLAPDKGDGWANKHFISNDQDNETAVNLQIKKKIIQNCYKKKGLKNIFHAEFLSSLFLSLLQPNAIFSLSCPEKDFLLTSKDLEQISDLLLKNMSRRDREPNFTYLDFSDAGLELIQKNWKFLACDYLKKDFFHKIRKNDLIAAAKANGFNGQGIYGDYGTGQAFFLKKPPKDSILKSLKNFYDQLRKISENREDDDPGDFIFNFSPLNYGKEWISIWKDPPFTLLTLQLTDCNYEPKKPFWINFSALLHKDFSKLSFYNKKYDLFPEFNYYGILDIGVPKGACQSFYSKELYPHFWDELKKVDGVANGNSMGGHGAVKWAFQTRKSCLVGNPVVEASDWVRGFSQRVHIEGLKDPYDANIAQFGTLIHPNDLNTCSNSGTFHTIYLAISDESPEDLKHWKMLINSQNLNSLYATVFFDSQKHCAVNAVNLKDYARLFSSLYALNSSGEDSSQEEQQKIILLDQGEKSDSEINDLIATQKKVILLNHTCKAQGQSNAFAIGCLFDKPLEEKDLENLKGSPNIFMRQEKITKEGVDYMRKALCNLPFVEFVPE